MLLLECLYQSGACSLIPQIGLSGCLSDGKGEGHPSCEEHFWIIHAGSPGKWWALAACVDWPPRGEALDLGYGTSGELHTRTLSLPQC